jgi:hypothetical protein
VSRARVQELLDLATGLGKLAGEATTQMGQTDEPASWRELATLATLQQAATSLQAIAEALLPPDPPKPPDRSAGDL